MNSVNRTLYIPLYGKAFVSERGMILRDPKAEEIWKKEGFSLKGKSASKWLAYYMSMRAAVFDRWVADQMKQLPDAVVIHIGCGMDSRILRVGDRGHLWFDLDFPEVIRERSRYFEQTDFYKMLGSDVTQLDWLEQIPKGNAIIVMEGVSMYLTASQRTATLEAISHSFDHAVLLMDCYTTFAAKASKVKNPINDVGVTQVYGLDDPEEAACGRFRFVSEYEMTPDDLIGQLHGGEKWIFRKLYAGSFAKKMYRMYNYEIGIRG